MSAVASILCVGPSHKTASLAARERFALVGRAGAALREELCSHPDVLEAVAVATCNRSELYLAVTDIDLVLPAAVAAFARLAEADVEEISTMLAVRHDSAAVQHLFRVAAGVESVVIGEAEIQGQLKQALKQAADGGSLGPLLDRLFRHALEVGKRARTETRIGHGRASVGSVAAELVCQRLGDLRDRQVLVVGAGKMSALTARSLAARGAHHVFVANRSAARAAHLAEQCGGTAVGFDQLDAQLALCDVVISSTSAPHPLLTLERVEAALAARNGRPLVLVDLAVPRDIEAEVGTLHGCHLFDLDDLERVVAQTVDVRNREVVAAADIAHDAALDYLQWRRSQRVVPAITTMRARAEDLRSSEFARFERRFEHLAPEDRRRVEQLTRSIVNKLLHQPTVVLREAAVETEQPSALHAYAGAVERLFGADTIVD